MNILEFIKQFPDEESCKKEWKKIRENQGVVCPKCGCKEHYWKQDKESFECKKCGYRQGLKANTVMHNSNLPIRYWFITMHLLTTTKKTFSAAELQRQLGHKYYDPIWLMLQKLRKVMGEKDADYKLMDEIELDEGFFTATPLEEDRHKPNKQGRGSKKAKVFVMAESEEVKQSDKQEDKEDKDKKNKHKRYHTNRKVGRIKMQVIPDLKSSTIDKQLKDNTEKTVIVNTDASTSYTHFKDMVREHKSQVITKTEIGKVLPWVHIAISNAKRQLLDIFHDISIKYLQNYLNEFCYKFNRRYYGESLFENLLILAATHKNTFR